MELKGDDVNISFLPVVPDTIRVQLEQVEATSIDISPPDSIEKPVFGPRPNSKAADLNFEAEIQCLPFKLNFGEEANMTHIQQGQFIDLIVIPMTTDRPVYLLHLTIPPQLQGEVHKCLDIWL